MTTPNKIRVQPHCAQLRVTLEGASEVTIGITVIENVREGRQAKESADMGGG